MVEEPAPRPEEKTVFRSPYPLLVIAGPTASGKTALALHLAERTGGEILSCDSVAIYRELDVGSAKPSAAERARIRHFGLDVLRPDEPTTAGDYLRLGRAALTDMRTRGVVPVVAGGTGLYLRALLHGLAPAPSRDESLRERLRGLAERRGSAALHRLLRRVDSAAAAAIHPNDTPKLVRSLEVSMLARAPQTVQWQVGREPLEGFAVLQLGLEPPRPALYGRINARAAAMFTRGLLEETAAVRARYGDAVRSLGSLGYAQAGAVLRGDLTLSEAIAAAQQGHRHYAKRQLTWFRREPAMHWFHGFGDDVAIQQKALTLVDGHLRQFPNRAPAI